jgi:hypothetical protein
LREARWVVHPGGRVVIVDWQRPKSVARAMTSALFLIYFLQSCALNPTEAPAMTGTRLVPGDLGSTEGTDDSLSLSRTWPKVLYEFKLIFGRCVEPPKKCKTAVLAVKRIIELLELPL